MTCAIADGPRLNHRERDGVELVPPSGRAAALTHGVRRPDGAVSIHRVHQSVADRVQVRGAALSRGVRRARVRPDRDVADGLERGARHRAAEPTDPDPVARVDGDEVLVVGRAEGVARLDRALPGEVPEGRDRPEARASRQERRLVDREDGHVRAAPDHVSGGVDPVFIDPEGRIVRPVARVRALGDVELRLDPAAGGVARERVSEVELVGEVADEDDEAVVVLVVGDARVTARARQERGDPHA